MNDLDWIERLTGLWFFDVEHALDDLERVARVLVQVGVLYTDFRGFTLRTLLGDHVETVRVDDSDQFSTRIV